MPLGMLLEEDKKNGVEGVPPIESIGNHDEITDIVVASIAKNVLWQMDNDRKSTALKRLQGHMWRSAYEQKLIQG